MHQNKLCNTINEPYVTNKTVDVSQLIKLNVKNSIDKALTKLALLKLAKNQQRRQPSSNQMDVDERVDVFHDEDCI